MGQFIINPLEKISYLIYRVVCLSKKKDSELERLVVDQARRSFNEGFDGFYGNFSKRLSKKAERINLSHLPATILVTGPPRVGKTILAKMVAEKTGMLHFEVDRIRPIFWNIEDYEDRLRVRNETYLSLIRVFPKGLIIEGSDLCCQNHKCKKQVVTSLEHVSFLISRENLKVFVVGNSTEEVIKKSASIMEYRRNNICWTNNAEGGVWSDANLIERAKEIIERSKDLQVLCKQDKRVKYFNIRADCFNLQLSCIVDEIVELCMMPDLKRS